MKTCSKKDCQKSNPQPMENFSPNSWNKDGKQYSCKHCFARIKKQKYKKNPEKFRKQRAEYLEKNKEKAYVSTERWRKENKEQIKETKRKYKESDPKRWTDMERKAGLKKNYGITIEYYDNLLNQQNSLCAVCYKPETQKFKGKVKNLAVDHDHQTGQVRGLLCSDCNLSLGKLKEDIEIMTNMIEYVKKHKKVIKIA